MVRVVEGRARLVGDDRHRVGVTERARAASRGDEPFEGAWAVGDYKHGPVLRTLIEHWGGRRWKIQRSRNPAGGTHNNLLYGVAATSATNAWAVGQYSHGPGVVSKSFRPLALRWDGTAWKG